MINVYDPNQKVFRESSIDDYRKQLESFGFEEKEVEEKLQKALKAKKSKLKSLGLSDEEANKAIKSIK